MKKQILMILIIMLIPVISACGNFSQTDRHNGNQNSYEHDHRFSEEDNIIDHDETGYCGNTLTVISRETSLGGEPPELNIISGNISRKALLGTYSWNYKNDDETSAAVCSDSAHPLDNSDLLPCLETTETTAVLNFEKNPDSIINIRCWSDKHWEDSSAESENVPVNGNKIELKKGGYIYEITAEWNTEKTDCGGTAHYSFYAKVS